MTSALRAFVKIVDGFSFAGAIAAALALAMISAIMLAEIAIRFMIGSTLDFSWEYSAYLMSAAFFLGAAYTLRCGAHIRMGVFVEHVSPGLARAFDLVSTLVGLAVMASIAVALGDLAWQAFVRGARSFTPMETYLAIPQAVPALGAGLVVLQLLARLATHALGISAERPVLDDQLTVDR